MTNSPNMTDEEVRRLSWRCRRGLLELDIVLQRFAAHYLAGLTQVELVALDGLLVQGRQGSLSRPNFLVQTPVIMATLSLEYLWDTQVRMNRSIRPS